MNKNEECNIVKDLSSLHIENLLSQGSKEFVDKHLENCEPCRRYYKDLNFMFFNEEKVEKKNDEIEINHLKKVNRKLTTLKWIIALILWGILAMLIIMYVRTGYINEIAANNNLKIRDIKFASTNYKLIHKTIYTNKENYTTEESEYTYYYKDGMNKKSEVYYRDGVKVDEKIRYIRDYGYEKITVFPMLKQIDYQSQDFIETRLGDGLTPIVVICSGMTNRVRTEMFDGKECWVINRKSSAGYTDDYIEKETDLLVRTVEDTYSYYKEEQYILTEGTVTDEDIDTSILDTEEFSDYKKNYIEYNISEELKTFYE